MPSWVPDPSSGPWVSGEEWERRKANGRQAERRNIERARRILADEPDPEQEPDDDQEDQHGAGA